MSEKITTARNSLLIDTYYPTDSTLVLTYEHIITQNKNYTNIKKLNVVIKTIAGTDENNTYNFEEQIACLYIITSWMACYPVSKIWLKWYCNIYCSITSIVPNTANVILPFNTTDSKTPRFLMWKSRWGWCSLSGVCNKKQKNPVLSIVPVLEMHGRNN